MLIVQFFLLFFRSHVSFLQSFDCYSRYIQCCNQISHLFWSNSTMYHGYRKCYVCLIDTISFYITLYSIEACSDIMFTNILFCHLSTISREFINIIAPSDQLLMFFSYLICEVDPVSRSHLSSAARIYHLLSTSTNL